MQIQIQTFTVHKRFPLTISRGTTAESNNILVKIQQEGIEGWGEASPFSLGEKPQTTKILQQTLEQVAPSLEKFTPLDRQQIEQVLIELEIPSAARAAIDMALHDWVGKKVGLPLWRLWGLERDHIVPISVTIGISTPEAAKQRVRNWLEFIHARVLKVKLGSPEGIEADQAMLMAVKKEAPADALLYVDANGGWSLEDAVKMCDWLATVGVIYVEQPLAAVSAIADLPHLYSRSPLPIFVDESCFTAKDIPILAEMVHGINIKLMKSGGLTEAMRMVYVAKACGLKVMFGCYSDSCLANTAAVQLAPLADYLDLDSHLNLIDDPFIGAEMEKGRLLPNDLPGLGVCLNSGMI
ncbi:MAG: dipeptide epimerase [Okeania sp. SIO2G4]|uniref:dipeptide epimerase n=1 Tax=unclassified Okeania TaxID=2634635 RepID=UPI0013BC9CFB|nr:MULTISPECIES: dipeptide epimerase [unclassified Okeania]NEP72561.1 dipeptide epimerase [Okeania sp. SIO2G5]NEP95380.1 dipeptide epimerase [Okeania sp. SIO2F5]NEQ92957.1 dipeptide epimerase [Okeania sp. SIO2G4]